MRGVVSLAAALAVPLILLDGSPFPGRDYILFVTFCVILASDIDHAEARLHVRGTTDL